MTKKTGYLLGILLTIIICMILAWIFCCGATGTISDDDPDNRNAVVTEPTATSMPFAISGPSGDFSVNSNDNFNFDFSGFKILTPVSEDIESSVQRLIDYFTSDGNANKKLNITGFYDEGENNPSAFENLGLARANAVKNYLVDKGIASNRINTLGKFNASMVPDGSIYKGPVSYELFAQAAEAQAAERDQMDQVADAIKAEPLVLYFDYGEASVTLTEKQRLQIGDMSRYLDKVDGATITIEGHTDSQGSNTTNNRLGLERAEYAKAYLVNNGIATAKIKTISKGERQPIATNTTEEGRAKNRRAVVTIN